MEQNGAGSAASIRKSFLHVIVSGWFPASVAFSQCPPHTDISISCNPRQRTSVGGWGVGWGIFICQGWKVRCLLQCQEYGRVPRSEKYTWNGWMARRRAINENFCTSLVWYHASTTLYNLLLARKLIKKMKRNDSILCFLYFAYVQVGQQHYWRIFVVGSLCAESKRGASFPWRVFKSNKIPQNCFAGMSELPRRTNVPIQQLMKHLWILWPVKEQRPALGVAITGSVPEITWKEQTPCSQCSSARRPRPLSPGRGVRGGGLVQ